MIFCVLETSNLRRVVVFTKSCCFYGELLFLRRVVVFLSFCLFWKRFCVLKRLGLDEFLDNFFCVF